MKIISLLITITFVICFFGCKVEKKRELPNNKQDSIYKQNLRYYEYQYTISDYALQTYKYWGSELFEFFDKTKYLDKQLGFLLRDLESKYPLLEIAPDDGYWQFENFRYHYSYYFNDNYFYAIVVYVGNEGVQFLESKPYNLKYLKELTDWDVIQYRCDLNIYRQRFKELLKKQNNTANKRDELLHKIDSITAAWRDVNAFNSVVLPQSKINNPKK